MATNRRRRNRNKKVEAIAEIKEFEKAPEKVVKLPPQEKKQTKPKYLYRQIMPHEIEGLIPLIKDFYKAINYKEAAENPLPFIAQINREMVSNPYSIIYACVDQQLKPQGYMWFRVDVNPLGQKYIHIEHDYVIPELRKTFTEARIHREFINYVIEVADRNNTQYVTTCVRSTDLEKSRKKLGFKSVEVKMTFKGTAEDFRAENPSFYKFYKTDEVE